MIGIGRDFTNAGAYCNVWATGAGTSGIFRVAVQTAPSDVSGSYTDPTSGLANFPSNIISGGILVCASGGNASGGSNMVSGGMEWGAFLRPAGHPWVRATVLSGNQHNGHVSVGFLEQLKTTGSGIGYTWLPSSGTAINV